jgi:type I restriction enzyme, S subunit
MAFNQGCRGLVPLPDMDGRFLAYQLLAKKEDLQAAGQGSTFMELSGDALAATRLAKPPLHEQRRIADLLDDQVALLDRAITLRQQQIALLRERAAARLNEVVLDCLARHQSIRVQHLLHEVDERGGQRELPLLSVSIHRGVVPRTEMTDKEPRAEDLSNYKVCQPGDIVLNRMRAFQGAIGVSVVDGLVSPDYAVLRPSDGVDAEWLDYLFRSNWFVGQMTMMLRGLGSADLGSVRTPRVNVADIRLIEVPDVAVMEQRQVVGRIKAEAEWRDRVASLSRQQADLLVERKRALITAAVTGEIDVTTVRSVA